MGAFSSTEVKRVSREEEEVEATVASIGALPLLQNVFSKLSYHPTKSIPVQSLQKCFGLNFTFHSSETSMGLACTAEQTALSRVGYFPDILACLGPAIIEVVFGSDKESISWMEFLRGYISCCGRLPSSRSLNLLYRLYETLCTKSGISSKLEFENDKNIEGKTSGFFMTSDVLMLFWMCWIMMQSSRVLKLSKKKLILPDVDSLLSSVLVSCDIVDILKVSDCNCLVDYEIPAQKFHAWALSAIPNLSHCLTQYFHDMLQRCAYSEENLEPLVLSYSKTIPDSYLLTHGRAWAISLSLRSTISEELLNACISEDVTGIPPSLLYQASIHGKGLSRFWSHIEGFQGPVFILISASSTDCSDSSIRRWVIGILTQQGFENKDAFYGSSGFLYAISPVFNVFSPSGKDKNFIYSRLHPTGRVYKPNSMPVGIAFGGTVGNERIFLDEDFSRVVIRHHTVDRTYQPGSLIPCQGFLSVDASILNVEVWGLGGEVAKEKQNEYKKRELIFSEQRRKVDLGTFASWDDSPEKMLMNMISDPNKVEREDR